MFAAITPLSAEQIQYKLDELTMRRDQIQSMMDASVPTTHDLDVATKKMDDKEGADRKKISTASEKLNCLRLLCQLFNADISGEIESCKKQVTGISNYCTALNDQQILVQKLMRSAIGAKTRDNSVKNQMHAYEASSNSLQQILKQVQDQINVLKKELETVTY